MILEGRNIDISLQYIAIIAYFLCTYFMRIYPYIYNTYIHIYLHVYGLYIHVCMQVYLYIYCVCLCGVWAIIHNCAKHEDEQMFAFEQRRIID